MRQIFRYFYAVALALVMCVLSQNTAFAAQAGWREITVPPGVLEFVPTVVALYYPTSASARKVVMGAFNVTAAIQADPLPNVKGLIILSHGTSGSELGHSTLAQALAQSGYLVAALRHPGDNWMDTSMRDRKDGGRYFVQRPRQVSHVIDALLQDPLWKDRIAKDSRGPRIAVIGHSAGGYTALAMIGGQPDLARVAEHCKIDSASDPTFCGMTRALALGTTDSSNVATDLSVKVDTRVRAVAVLAPMGAAFTAASLASITVPTLLYEAGSDRFLVPRFHSAWIARNMPSVQKVNVPDAWHFAFMDTPNMPLPSPDGDVGANAPGFDRAAFLDTLGQALPAFFDKSWE